MNLAFLADLQPLPSSSSAADFIEGKPGAFGRVILHTAGRSVLIGAGLYAAGFRKKELVKGAVAAALAIELFAFAWFLSQNKNQ